VNLEKIKEIFYADCSDEEVEHSKKLFGPEPRGPLADGLLISDERFGGVPRVYIECLQDNPHSCIKKMAKRVKILVRIELTACQRYN
jgi:hypothetical protein